MCLLFGVAFCFDGPISLLLMNGVSQFSIEGRSLVVEVSMVHHHYHHCRYQPMCCCYFEPNRRFPRMTFWTTLRADSEIAIVLFPPMVVVEFESARDPESLEL